MSRTKRKDRPARVESLLLQFFERLRDTDRCAVQGVATFQGVGMMTNDRGVVVMFEDDTEVQISVVRSR